MPGLPPEMPGFPQDDQEEGPATAGLVLLLAGIFGLILAAILL